MAKILARDYVSGVVGTLAWCAARALEPAWPLGAAALPPCATALHRLPGRAYVLHSRLQAPSCCRAAPEMLWGERCSEKAE